MTVTVTATATAAGVGLDRRKVVAELLANRGDLLVVAGLGSPVWDCAAVGDHPLNFYLWGAMGSAAMIGLGLALARPERRVLVLTGDGEPAGPAACSSSAPAAAAAESTRCGTRSPDVVE